MLALARDGMHVRVYAGPTWSKWLTKSGARSLLEVRGPAVGLDYARAIAGSTISLAFLSRLNRDTYTRRNFEIPASQGLMLSERTDDLGHLYKDGSEALFFSDTEDLLERSRFVLENPQEAQQIALRGHQRAVGSGYDLDSRMADMISDVERLRS